MSIGRTNMGGAGIGYPYHIKAIAGSPLPDRVTITWTDPDDADWIGTKLVRREGRYPLSPNDGRIVANIRQRNLHAASGFVDNTVEGGVVYYYQAFPYFSLGHNTSYLNRLSPMYTYGVTYTGAYTDRMVTSGGATYRLLTLTTSGVLTVTGALTADVCLVGGGAGGSPRGSGFAGAGAYMVNAVGVSLLSGPVQIGAGGTAASRPGGTTSYAGLAANGAAGNNGGTGAGGYGNGVSATVGTGDGQSKIPMDRAEFFTVIAGGGGSGGYYNYYSQSNSYDGGAGGSNGGNGGAADGPKYIDESSIKGGRGSSGGGNGGDKRASGGNATSPGSGGGGGGVDSSSQASSGLGGNGAAGVVYILIPILAA